MVVVPLWVTLLCSFYFILILILMLPECVRAVLRSVGYITNTGKCRRFRTKTKNLCTLFIVNTMCAKVFCVLLKEKYKNYENTLNLDSLKVKRKEMYLKFEKSGIKNNTLNYLFPICEKMHHIIFVFRDRCETWERCSL